MSADNLIRNAFDQGLRAGDRDRPRRVCPYAPHFQHEKFVAWQLGYDEASPNYVVAKA